MASEQTSKRAATRLEAKTRKPPFQELLPFVLGAALIALSIIEKDSEEISVVFAVGGVLVLVLFLFASQLESLEIGTRGAKAVLRKVREVAVEENLTAEEKTDEILEILEPAEPEPVPAARAASARMRGSEFERVGREYFIAQGWTPRSGREGGADFGFDFVGEREGHVLVAEFKARTRFASADVALAYEQLERAAKVLNLGPTNSSLVLAVPTQSITATAQAFAQGLIQEDSRFRIVEIDPFGDDQAGNKA